MRGNLMMEADSTTRPWESNYAVYHDVFNRHEPPYLDFSHYREAITNGTARFTFTSHEQSAGQEFRGNYFDNIQFGLVFPILKLPDPTGLMLIVK
jgi:hypothetical protein